MVYNSGPVCRRVMLRSRTLRYLKLGCLHADMYIGLPKVYYSFCDRHKNHEVTSWIISAQDGQDFMQLAI